MVTHLIHRAFLCPISTYFLSSNSLLISCVPETLGAIAGTLIKLHGDLPSFTFPVKSSSKHLWYIQAANLVLYLQWTAEITMTWEDKCPNSECLPRSFTLSPALYADYGAIWYRVSLWSVGQHSQLCPLSTLCAPPVSSLVGWRARKGFVSL